MQSGEIVRCQKAAGCHPASKRDPNFPSILPKCVALSFPVSFPLSVPIRSEAMEAHQFICSFITTPTNYLPTSYEAVREAIQAHVLIGRQEITFYLPLMTHVLTGAKIRRAVVQTTTKGNAKAIERCAKCIFPSNYIIGREMEIHLCVLLNLPK